MSSLRTKNLNLIPILRALLHQQSVARAAEEVSLSQSAVSGALARLRENMDDPLLYRSGREMRLTPRATRLSTRLDQICEEIEGLFAPERFEPATAQRYFVVGAPDYLVFLLSGTLLVRLRDEAPGIRIRFVDVPYDLPNWMRDGSIDLAVCGDFGIWPGLRSQVLMRERIVAAVGQGHPLLSRQRVTSADLLAYPSLNFTPSTPSRALSKPVTGLPSLDWAPQISTGQFVDAVLLAVNPPMVARAPALLVERLARMLPITAIELADERTEHDTGMFWSAINEEVPEHVWLRNVVKESLMPLATPRHTDA